MKTGRPPLSTPELATIINKIGDPPKFARRNIHPSHQVIMARNNDALFCVKCHDLRLGPDQREGFAEPCSPSRRS